MPSPRRAPAVLSAVLSALLVAGCGTDVVQGRASPAPRAGAESDPLSAVTSTEPLAELLDVPYLPGGVVLESRLAADDGAVLLLQGKDEDTSGTVIVVHQAGDAWEQTVLDEPRIHPERVPMDVTDDGTAIVVGLSSPDARLVVTTVPRDGGATSAEVDVDLGDAEYSSLDSAVVTPSGQLVFVFLAPPGDDPVVLAVDPRTGEVLAERTLTDDPGLAYSTSVTADGGLLLATSTDTDEDGESDQVAGTWFDAALEPVQEAVLTAEAGLAGVHETAVDDEGTAYLLVRFDAADELGVLRVQSDGAVTELTRFPGRYPDQIAVDPVGDWVYVVGEVGDAEETQRIVLPVDARTGAEAQPIVLCESLYATDLLISASGDAAWTTVACVGESNADLFALGRG